MALVNRSEDFKRMQEEFLKLHLVPWIPSFADKVAISTTSPFYRKIASVLKEFLNDEVEYLGIDS